MTISVAVALGVLALLGVAGFVFVWLTVLPVPPKQKEKPPTPQVMFIYPPQEQPASPTGSQGMTGTAKLTLKS